MSEVQSCVAAFLDEIGIAALADDSYAEGLKRYRLHSPAGMMRWYMGNEFMDRPEEKQMLLAAYEMRALVILVDGVDEAAGLRDIVEATRDEPDAAEDPILADGERCVQAWVVGDEVVVDGQYLVGITAGIDR